MDRAYSLLEIKSFDEDQRIIEGICSTPMPDRMGDIVNPHGARFQLPMPLLWQHDSKQPIGEVFEAKTTSDGISFKARIAKIAEPGRLKERLDESWQSIKSKLVRNVSIGFRSLKAALLKDGSGTEFQEFEVLEISAVTIAANQQAAIHTIRALSGDKATVSGQSNQRPLSRQITRIGVPVMAKKSLSDQIKDWEATRAAHSAICEELMEKSSDKGETLDAEQSDTYEDAARQVKNVDVHLTRLREQLKASAAAAEPIKADEVKSPAIFTFPVKAKKDVAPHLRFARCVMDIAAGGGVVSTAMDWSKRWDDAESTELVRAMLMMSKAVPGTTLETTGQWGSELVYPVTQGFLELLLPQTIFGKIGGWRTVPFNVRVVVQLTGSTVNWVAEAAAKPVSELSFDTVTMTYSKISGIVVISEELVRLSSPSAQQTVSDDLVRQIAKFIDEQLLDTSVTETTSRPASITNNVSAIPASGTDFNAFIVDFNDALATFDAAEMTAKVLITTPAVARGLSGMFAPLGNVQMFPAMTPNGGSIQGFQVIVSNNCPDGLIVFVDPSNILLADDGRVTVDTSNQATLDMAGGNSPTFSLYQKNCVGIRAERWIRWKKARSAAVAVISGAAYVPGTGTA